MATIQERLATRMRWWADEGNIGYDWDWPDRWHFWVGGEVDCSSLVISVCKELGLDVGGASFTGDMRENFCAHGWVWIPGRPSLGTLKPGDVLLRESKHTAMYVGDGLISQASANEFGGTSGGQSGDQGRPNGVGETNTVAFNPSYAWDGVLRYMGPDPEAAKRKTSRPTGKEDGGAAGPVYRLYNKASGAHHWTTSETERDELRKSGWTGEGVAFTASGSGGRVYRLYNPHNGQHLWTSSLTEAQVTYDAGWEFEGVAWRDGGGTPVWRLYNVGSHEHMYTASNMEHAQCVRSGWKQEGIGFWAK